MAPRRPFPRLAALAPLAILLLALGSPAPAHAAGCAGADLQPAAGNLPQVAQATVCLLDEQRAARGLTPTRRNARLEQASARYSRRMVAESFFAHVAPDGERLTERLLGAGYIARADDYVLGENLAWGQAALSTPRSIVTAWMNSPGHRENVLRREFAEIGVAFALGTPEDPTRGATVTSEYGVRTPAARGRCAVARSARSGGAKRNGRTCARPARRTRARA
jgi:uncharacterized protein YkwD